LGKVVNWKDIYETQEDLIRDIVLVDANTYRGRGFSGAERLQELQFKLIIGQRLAERDVKDMRILAGEVNKYHGG